MKSRRRSGFLRCGLYGMMLVAAGCQDQITDPTLFEAEPHDAVVHANPAHPVPFTEATTRLAGLGLEARFRTIGVPFPSVMEVGTCYTQVTKSVRPVPFTFDRLTFEAPQAAIAEADGASILLEYRFRSRNGMVIEAARCRVPDSRLAVEQVFGHLAEHGLGARRVGLKAAVAAGLTGMADGWVVSVDTAPLPQGDVVGGSPCEGSGTEEDPCILEGVEPESCDSWYQEWDESLEECVCANGSPYWDCWIHPDDPEYPDDPPGGGGGGGGSGGPVDFDPVDPDEDAESWFLEALEVICDGPPLANPAQEVRRQAWCNAVPVSSTDSAKVAAALDRIEAVGGICATLAARGRTYLAMGNIRRFEPFSGNPAAVARNHRVAIHSIYFGEKEIDSGSPHDPRTLQFILAHELDHLLPASEGGQGPGHIDALNLQTKNSATCGGFGGL